MGTRSTIRFKENENTLVSIYQQYDGYPSGVGGQIIDALQKYPIADAYSPDQIGQVSNGLSCLAALYIKENKESTGNLYIIPESHFGDSEFNYEVTYLTKEKIYHIQCNQYDKHLFSGDLTGFVKFVAEYEN